LVAWFSCVEEASLEDFVVLWDPLGVDTRLFEDVGDVIWSVGPVADPPILLARSCNSQTVRWYATHRVRVTLHQSCFTTSYSTVM
jgi:hypothetical protein